MDDTYDILDERDIEYKGKNYILQVFDEDDEGLHVDIFDDEDRKRENPLATVKFKRTAHPCLTSEGALDEVCEQIGFFFGEE